ncbi:hypothetical protein [[Phormidium] sp. ETS-05]|nr:hypothetical protein [[Phormidium] sp. ETS-05]
MMWLRRGRSASGKLKPDRLSKNDKLDIVNSARVLCHSLYAHP